MHPRSRFWMVCIALLWGMTGGAALTEGTGVPLEPACYWGQVPQPFDPATCKYIDPQPLLPSGTIKMACLATTPEEAAECAILFTYCFARDQIITTDLSCQGIPPEPDIWFYCGTGGLTWTTPCPSGSPKACVNVTARRLTTNDGSVAKENCDACSGGFVDASGICVKPPNAVFVFSPPMPETGESVTFNASLSTSSGQIVHYIWDFGDGNGAIVQDITATHAYTRAGQLTVTLTVIDSNGLTATTSQVVSVTVSLPTGEITASPPPPDPGWEPDLPTVYDWKVTLTPTTKSFAGRQVREIFEPGTGSDTCWDKDSALPQFANHSSGPPWNINPDNTFDSPDRVGWLPEHVDYYRHRKNPRLPCSLTLIQHMVIDHPDFVDGYNYVTNILYYEMTLTTVTSRRAGQQASRRCINVNAGCKP